jgi:hypothetical protein
MRPADALLCTKVQSPNSAALGFIARAGGRVYQRCAGVVIDPRDPDVRGGVASNAGRG